MTAEQHHLDVLALYRGIRYGGIPAVSIEDADPTIIYKASFDLARSWRSHLWDESIDEQAEYTEQCQMDWEELGETLHRIMRAVGREKHSRV